VADEGAVFRDGDEVDPETHANKVCAVDKSIIPLGSMVNIAGMGTYEAKDTGGKVKGHIIDIYIGDTTHR